MLHLQLNYISSWCQNAASVGKVRPTVPTLCRPIITGISNPTAPCPTIATVVSIATVADPTAALIIIANKKAKTIIGKLKLVNNSTKASPTPLPL